MSLTDSRTGPYSKQWRSYVAKAKTMTWDLWVMPEAFSFNWRGFTKKKLAFQNSESIWTKKKIERCYRYMRVLGQLTICQKKNSKCTCPERQDTWCMWATLFLVFKDKFTTTPGMCVSKCVWEKEMGWGVLDDVSTVVHLKSITVCKWAELPCLLLYI